MGDMVFAYPCSYQLEYLEERRRQLTVLLETILITEKRPLDPEPGPTSALALLDGLQFRVGLAHFLQFGHSNFEASLSPHPAHLIILPIPLYCNKMNGEVRGMKNTVV